MRKGHKSFKKKDNPKHHKSKYSGDKIGQKEKLTIESLLSELREIEDVFSDPKYKELKYLDPNSKKYYLAVRNLYYNYFSQ